MLKNHNVFNIKLTYHTTSNNTDNFKIIRQLNRDNGSLLDQSKQALQNMQSAYNFADNDLE